MTCPANGNLGPHRCGACDNDVDDAEDLRAQLAAAEADRDRLFEAAVIAVELTGTVECNLDLQDRPSKTLGVAVVKLADALRAMTTKEWKPNG
jgi:hypothetical protein